MKQLLIECVRAAGQVLLEHFGTGLAATQKESQSQVVTAADLAAERCVVERIGRRFPDHSIIAEESGFQRRASDLTWVVDPLDGTSNFAAGIPWFGVMIALLQADVPVLAAMYVPVTDTLYLGEAGQGVSRDGTQVRVTAETDLRNVLCAYGLDSSDDERKTRREVEVLSRLANRARNVRATNSLLDLCYTLDGRFGGCINQATKIWDIAPAALMLPEAGGVLTDPNGEPIRFRLAEEPYDRTYAIVGASRALHPQLIELIRGSESRL